MGILPVLTKHFKLLKVKKNAISISTKNIRPTQPSYQQSTNILDFHSLV